MVTTYTLIPVTDLVYTVVTTVPVGGGSDLVTVNLTDLESTNVTLVGVINNNTLYLFKDQNGNYWVVQ